MNDYVTLNGKRYTAPFGMFAPRRSKPSRVRYNLSGALDVTYGPALPLVWEGKLKVPAVEADSDPEGDIDDFRVAIALKTSMAFIDHYGNSYTVHLLGNFVEDPKIPVLDSVDNVFYIPVRIIRAT